MQDGNTLFDTNNEFVDGGNIGRLVYFETDEFSHTGNIQTTPVTASVFETFILPGETNLQVSQMIQYTNNNSSDVTFVKSEMFIQSASATASMGSSYPSVNAYNSWSVPEQLNTGTLNLLTNNTGHGGVEGLSITFDAGRGTTPSNAILPKYQGKHVRIFQMIFANNNGHSSSILKVKGQVFRTSRLVGGSTSPPQNIQR